MNSRRYEAHVVSSKQEMPLLWCNSKIYVHKSISYKAISEFPYWAAKNKIFIYALAFVNKEFVHDDVFSCVFRLFS